MPRLPGSRAVPWMMVLEAALVARDHWGRLEDDDRAELARIVRKSKMRPGHLTDRERDELRRIVARLDLLKAGKRLMPLPRGTSALRRLNRLRRAR